MLKEYLLVEFFGTSEIIQEIIRTSSRHRILDIISRIRNRGIQAMFIGCHGEKRQS
ncbi:hypothetical protein BDP27DRAFT_1332966 [Rhodocollybia butyracea]|uniref:Uncharacterized protein n=1 Tax=Rhodocollybia butyracea TaxID=206335 RepID=A0A9P5U4I8_9AGAR|nr:hypothetical protein BDP27DRAFT_1332966 [Rhodocollybia butyracea]